MTRFDPAASDAPSLGHWPLQDAKARFSELVRRARGDGPQHVTIHGVEAVVVVSVEEFRRLQGGLTGAALIAALQGAPHKEADVTRAFARSPARNVIL